MTEGLSAGPAFEQILRDYYRVWFRYYPEAAVQAGVPDYAHLLTPYNEDAHAAVICLNNELIIGLDDIDKDRLNPDQKLDFDILCSAAHLQNQFLLEIQQYHIDPERFLPINAIYQLLIRPVPDFAASLSARLAAVSDHLAGAREYLRDKAERIPSVWLGAAIVSARRGAEFIRDLRSHPKLADAAVAGLEKALPNAAQSLLDYAQFLEQEIGEKARGDFACGPAYFNAALRRRHFLDIDAEQLYEFGKELFAKTQSDLKTACKKLFGTDDIAAASRRIKADHPQPENLLGVYRHHMQAARVFVSEKNLVTLPQYEALEVVETPVFLRHQIPFAAYSEPSPNDPAQQGYYYVTPPADAGQLAEHNNAGIMNTCVHEAWPGHHLQFVSANLNPAGRSLPRLLNASATLYEGWALYCEQLMQEQGFLSRPEQHFLLLQDRLWRALRIMIDIEIQTRGLSLAAAAERMVSDLGFPYAQAYADLMWYSKSPTVPLSYATGWALINALRDHLRADAADFTLQAFHDRLLSAGTVALPLVIQRLFGEAAWTTARETAFGIILPTLSSP